MALGDIKFLQFKSKEQLEKERVEYEAWAFPYGDKQKEALTSTLKELSPKGSDKLMLISFLTCKEVYEKSVKGTDSKEAAIRDLILRAKNYKNLILKKDLSMYVAIVVADAAVDESCEYPTVEELRKHMQEIDELLGTKRKKR